jgi:DNA end-binding protein Ku
MPRPIWKGAISFGLVNVPVALYSAEARDGVRFRQLDRATHTPVREHRINEQTGREVEWGDIVKGYEYSPDRYVVLSDEELESVNPRATRTIDIDAFVSAQEIDPRYYDKPYYIAPTQGGRKGYALLREALRRSERVAIAKVVIRTKEYLAAVTPAGPVLLLEILRYAHELRDAAELDVPGADLEELGVKDREVALAEQLIEAMVEPWQPEKYRDEYRDEVLELVQRKVESGKEHETFEVAAVAPEAGAEVVDIMSLLKASVERQREDQATGTEGPAAARPRGKRKR